jgi:hypothetical protein
MRFLNKVVFINSATIRYAEVMVNGNVHLIGTQGVGKSTLLRAVLFFYNADTLKLGISREKKSFAEYYFPYQNSYLIYEVMRENGAYCIVAMKSQGKVCFRFMDTGYDRKYFLNDDGLAFDKWEDSRQTLDNDKIFYSNKIDRYEDYRNILYGNNDGMKRDFARFALLQSRQYQNIPRTIQNVFLNSKLEAEFIKQTIIMSLNEEDISIDLQSYTHHLKNFEEQLADIHQYKQASVQKLAENVVKLHLAIRHLEKEKNQQALQLAWAAANVERLIPKLYDKKEKGQADKDSLSQKAEGAVTRFRNKAEKIRGEISVLDNDLKRAKDKAEYYNKLNIEQLVNLVGKKKDLEAEFNQMTKERELLTSQFGEVSQKYTALLLALENGLKGFEQEKNGERLQVHQQAVIEEKAVRKWLDKSLAEVRQNNLQAVEQAKEGLEQQKQLIVTERLKREAIKHKRFFENETTATQQNIVDLDLSVKQATQQIGYLKSLEETLKKQWELDETGVKQQAERKQEKLQDKVAALKLQTQEIETKLQNSENSFYGWLNRNRKGWENNIGKVCSEAVLFSSSLEPKNNAPANSLFGVELDLNELNVQVKTVAELEVEKNKLEQEIATNQKQLHELQLQLQEQLDKLRRKYQPQIKECKDGIIEQQYKAEQDSHQLQQAQLQKKDLEIKAGDEKKKALAEVDSAIAAANEALVMAEQSLREVENEVHKQLKSKEREFDKRVDAIEQNVTSRERSVDASIAECRSEYEEQRAQVLARQQAELAGKGADTKRIAAVEERLTELQRELLRIEKNRDIVAEYKKDKRELIDKADEFKSRKVNLEQQYHHEEQKHQLQKENFRQEVQLIDERIEQIKEQLHLAEEDSETFNAFSVTEAYASIDAIYKEEKDTYRTDKRSKTLIDDINRVYYTAIKRLDDLKEAVNKFLGNFSERNIFNFSTSLSDRQQYLEFAEQLNEFINNSKIEEFEKRVNERFATIIHSVGRETGTLMSKGGEIQKVIASINNDFDNKNFVGAIRKIELRLDESENKVVQLLLQIKKFNDEHSFDLGGMNLFSTIDQDSKNKKASDLLKQLGKAIAEYKKESILLSDSFELKFRIEENQNDTGWVEKLSHVGSEGTDVLVKAMINIMLLNVFKEGASKRFKDFRLHCMMDEIGKLHPNNVKGILQFANDRNINLINGSPTETNAVDYKHIYKLEKDSSRHTRIKRIITNYGMS